MQALSELRFSKTTLGSDWSGNNDVPGSRYAQGFVLVLNQA